MSIKNERRVWRVQVIEKTIGYVDVLAEAKTAKQVASDVLSGKDGCEFFNFEKDEREFGEVCLKPFNN